MSEALNRMSLRGRVFLGLGLFLLLTIAMVVAVPKGPRNDAFKPQDEFKLTPWVPIKLGGLDVSITKAVFYILIACVLTLISMLWIARKMQERPNRVQTAVETIYGFMRTNITRDNMDRRMARKWFPFVATLFLFIWFSNLIGYLPLPTNTHEKVNLFGTGLRVPAFALYAATANLSVPLVLAVVVWISYNIEGIRAQGFVGYLRGLIPAGVPGPLKPFIFTLELASQFMRLISLSVRLFANILAGHLIILFMSGALAVILGIAAVAIVTLPIGIAIFAFEVALVATLQAFIFATLTAIYLGEASAAHH
jgi:F-type H+-transporting ATPase subunit a